MQEITKILVGLAPGVLWIFVFFLIFRKKTSARWNSILTIFLWGALITIPALLFEVAAEAATGISESNSNNLYILSSVFIIAPIEELLKLAVLRRGVFGTSRFKTVHDGVFLGIVIGLGFGTVENLLLVFQDVDLGVIIARALTATLLHAVAGGIIGFYLGLAHYDKSKLTNLSIQGVILASLFHGIYNLLVTLEIQTSLMLTGGLLVISYIFLFIASNELTKIKSQFENRA